MYGIFYEQNGKKPGMFGKKSRLSGKNCEYLEENRWHRKETASIRKELSTSEFFEATKTPRFLAAQGGCESRRFRCRSIRYHSGRFGQIPLMHAAARCA